MPTHDPATVVAVARAICDGHDDVVLNGEAYPCLACANSATAALCAPPVAAAFAALAEVARLLDSWPNYDRSGNSDYGRGVAQARDAIRAALPTPTTEETTHA